MITSLGGEHVSDPDDLAAAIAERRPDTRLAVEYERDGRRRSVDVTLGFRPRR